MKINLTKNLSNEEKEELLRQFKSSLLFRSQLKKCLIKERDSIINKMCLDEEFGPNWQIEQATRIAEIRSLDKLIALIEN